MARKTRSLGADLGRATTDQGIEGSKDRRIEGSKDRMREGLHRCSQPANDVLDAPERIDILSRK